MALAPHTRTRFPLRSLKVLAIAFPSTKRGVSGRMACEQSSDITGARTNSFQAGVSHHGLRKFDNSNKAAAAPHVTARLNDVV